MVATNWLFNGEIYNFRELRGQLEGGDSLGSSGDSVVLGECLRQHGPEATLPKLRGMFAFAWLDRDAHSVCAARDPFGIKPLYYHIGKNGCLTLGSEIKGMARLLPDGPEVNAGVLGDYFRWGSVQGPETILRGVRSVPPGHWLRWNGQRLEIEPYFEPRWQPKREWLDPREAVAETRKRVLESVRSHLIADVPVGVFLSGGLDSTIMAACMREVGVDRIEAFSVGYDGDPGLEDESGAARRSADFLGAEFTVAKTSSETLGEVFDHYIAHLDQPSGDALNTYLVSRLAREKVTVTLSGLGADEWFAGYNGHRMMALAHRLPLWRLGLGGTMRGLAEAVIGKLPTRLQSHRALKAFRYLSGMNGRGIRAMHSQGRTIFQSDEIRSLLVDGIVDQAELDGPPGDWSDAALDEAAPDSWVHKLLWLETRTFLQNTLLRDCDAVSMAHSLELRVPLVDPEIFDLAARMPPSAMLGVGGGKRVLREAFKDLLPPWIYEDRQKKTFTLPLMRWLREPAWQDRVMDTLRSRDCRERGWLRPEAIEGFTERFFRSGVDTKAGWRTCQTVWLMFILESWAIEHLDRAGSRIEPVLSPAAA